LIVLIEGFIVPREKKFHSAAVVVVVVVVVQPITTKM